MSVQGTEVSEGFAAATELAVAMAIAVVATAICLSASMTHGRLFGPSAFDDVTYLYAGQQWLNLVGTAGPFVGLYDLINQHAPLMTLTAAVGFLMFGAQDLAPYIMFGVLMAGFYFALIRLFGRQGAAVPAAMLLACCAAFVPFFRFVQTEFRPDMFAGIVTAFAIMALFQEPIFMSRPRRQFGVGLLFGLALLIKPSAFLAAGFVLTIATLLSVMAFAIQMAARLQASALSVVKSFGIIFAGAALVFLPHLVVHGNELLAYIEEALFSNQEYWAFEGTGLEHLAYYATGEEGGGRALGLWFWIALLTFALRLVTSFAGGKKELPSLLAGYVTIAALYAAISATAVKTYFLGSMFYATLTLFMLRDWAWFAAHPPPLRLGEWAGSATLLAIVLVTAAAVAGSSRELVLTPMEPIWSQETTQSTDAVSRMVNERLPGMDRPLVLLANNPDPVKTMAIGLQALRDGRRVDLSHAYAVETEDAFLALAMKADLVVVTGSMRYSLPGPRMGDAFQRVMRSSEHFRLVSRFVPSIHPPVEIYERIAGNVQASP